MNPEAQDLWTRAQTALMNARYDLLKYPDNAASRAYYAAFYAFSSLFALEGRFFSKHVAVEHAIHMFLIHQRGWPKELGRKYTELRELRRTGDYGMLAHVSLDEARDAIEMATELLEFINKSSPDDFPWTIMPA